MTSPAETKVRTRERDPEEEAVVSDLVEQRGETSEADILSFRDGVRRGFRRGKAGQRQVIADLQARLDAKPVIRETKVTSNGFTAGETRYVEVLSSYGMTAREIAPLFNVGEDAITDLLDQVRHPVIRFGAALQRGARGRVLQP